jgi:predicted RNase H-like nuclease (RuvC/YqgF family)
MWDKYDNNQRLYDAIISYVSHDENEKMISDSYLIDVIEKLIKEKENEHANTREEAFEEYISRLKLEIHEMKKAVAEANAEKEKIKRKLQIFLKVAAKTGMISKIKEETEKVIQEEKDYKALNVFFRNKMTSIENHEKDISELDKLFDK